MAKWEFTVRTVKERPIMVKDWDWGMATLIRFSFENADVSLGIPKDITREEMIKALEQAITALKEGGTHFCLPVTYAKERQEYIKRVREEEEAEVNGRS